MDNEGSGRHGAIGKAIGIGAWVACAGSLLATANIYWNHVGVHDTAEIAWMVLGLSITIGGYVFARAVTGVLHAIKT